jgi:hypothetical protein
MSPTRREFMRIIGLAFGALLTGRCASLTSTPTPDSPRGRVRGCWLKLDWLSQQFEKDWSQYEQAQRQLLAEHRAALDELTAAGELAPAAADLVQTAFDAMLGGQMIVEQECCMIELDPTPGPTPTPLPAQVYGERELADYLSTREGDLAYQAELLAEMAEQSGLDPEVVARTQSVIQRDMTLLNVSRRTMESLRDRIIESGYPPLDELEVEISPEAREAARFLVELLLEEQ